MIRISTVKLKIWCLSRYIFVVPGDPNFLARDLVTLNYTLSILYIPGKASLKSESRFQKCFSRNFQFNRRDPNHTVRVRRTRTK